MKLNLFLLSSLLAAMTAGTSLAQVQERERPAEWDNLVPGGRYMDRFEYMQGSDLESDVWGTEAVRPRLVDNGIELPGVSFWGGNIIKGEDGLYHLFVCGWPESSPRGHMFWSNSTVFHATSQNSYGPYKVVNSIGKGHNPEAYRLPNGEWLVYTIDGYYHARDPKGPWWFGKFKFDNRDRRIIEGLSNLTFARRQDGSMLMICRGGGVWISQDGISEYHQISDQRVYPAVEGRFEDPVVWRDSIQYHLIVNDWLGRIAFYERSKDGLHWVVEPGEAYTTNFTKHQDGKVEEWFKYERAKVLQDEYGRVEQMNFAVIDTIKWEDHPNDRHSSKNVCIKMNKGLLLSVLNNEPVTAKTKTIDLLVRAEKDFDPQNDLDLASLRFGSYKEVDFGRGAKVLKSRREGNDLVLTFKAKETGIDSDEFAPKLIGQGKDGHMVFGYSKLPGVDYTPALVSARRPSVSADGKQLVVKVENYGLKASAPYSVKVMSDGKLIGEGQVDALAPYGAHEVVISQQAERMNPDAMTFDVTLTTEGDVHTTHFEVPERKDKSVAQLNRPQKLLFLAIGQSNMVGKGIVAPEDTLVSPRFLNLSATENADRKIGEWRVAKPGNCRPGFNYANQVSPTDYFGRFVLEHLDSRDSLGILQVGVDGCPIRLFDKDQYKGFVDSCKLDWMNAELDAYDRNPYVRLITLAKQAQEQGWTIRGILVHQGETDAYSDYWPNEVRKVYKDILSDLQLVATDVPLLVGETAGIDQNGVCAHANPTLDRVHNFIATGYTISAHGCKVSEDFVHFSTEGYRRLGRRYGIKWLQLNGYDIQDDPDSQLQIELGNADDAFQVDAYIRQSDGKLMIASAVPLKSVDIVSFSGATLGTIELGNRQTSELDIKDYASEDRLILNIHSVDQKTVNKQVNKNK